MFTRMRVIEPISLRVSVHIRASISDRLFLELEVYAESALTGLDGLAPLCSN